MHGLYVSCRVFGTLEYLVNHKRRRRVRRMVELVLNRKLHGTERRRLIREHFMRQRCDKTFYMIFDLLPKDCLREHFKVVNEHLLAEGLKRGKGVYIMLCHHGQFHIAGLGLSVQGHSVTAVRAPNEGGVRRFVQDMWKNKHPDLPQPKFIFSTDFARSIYRTFKENGILGSSLDVSAVKDQRMSAVPVQVFGRRREFLTGTLQIAIRCGAVVLQAFIVAEDDFHYRFELLGPLTDADNCEETPELLTSVMQGYADRINEFAAGHPDHITRG